MDACAASRAAPGSCKAAMPLLLAATFSNASLAAFLAGPVRWPMVAVICARPCSCKEAANSLVILTAPAGHLQALRFSS